MRKISAQRVIGTLVLLLFAALVLLPLFWLGVSAFKSDADVIKWPPIFFPTEWVTTQFAYVWKVLPIARMLLNTVVFAGGVTIISLFFDSMAKICICPNEIYRKKTALWNHPAHDDDSVSGGDDSTLYGRI